MLRPGDVFAGYGVVRTIGAGGMGEVFLVNHPRLPRQDALKVLRPEISNDQAFRQRFIREADLAAALTHPHIVTVHDRGEHRHQLWIATQYIEGTDAAQLLRTRYPAGMPVEDACYIIRAIADALDYAHDRGLLHRDVKPANILLSEPARDGRRQVYLADFGIARPLVDANGLTATNMTLGTFAYSAPEQLMGDEVDGRADQYALAATAYDLLTGTPPFTAPSNPVAVISKQLNATPPPLSQHRPQLAALDDVFVRALAKNPIHRFPNCASFAAAVSEGALRVPPVSLSAATQTAGTAQEFPADAMTKEAVPKVSPDGPELKSSGRTADQPHTPESLVSNTRARTNTAIAAVAVLAIFGAISWILSARSSDPSQSSATSIPIPSTTLLTQAPLSSESSTIKSTIVRAAPASDIVGMIVFLDPGHNGDDAPMKQQVPNGRGATTDCESPGAYTASNFKEHTFNWDTVLRIRQALTSLGVRTAMSRGNDNARGACVDERAAMANSLQPNATISIHVNSAPVSDRGFYVTYSSPPLNAAQAGPSIQFARIMRDQLISSGIPASNYYGRDGLDPRPDVAGLNLAQYPAINVDLGNTDNPIDSSLIETEEGRQKYADAVVRGIAAFLQTQPPRNR